MKFETRLENLKEKIKEKDFLEMKGLGNEVAFWIFDYPPEKELLMRDRINKLVINLNRCGIKTLNIDLNDLCLDILKEKIDFEKIIDFEKKKGSDELLSKLKSILKPETVKRKIVSKLTEDYQLIFLTGIGKVWPLIRSHSILNNLQSVINNVPLIAFYPGNYSGLDLSLFGKFKDANYYRAFRLINEKE